MPRASSAVPRKALGRATVGPARSEPWLAAPSEQASAGRSAQWMASSAFLTAIGITATAFTTAMVVSTAIGNFDLQAQTSFRDGTSAPDLRRANCASGNLEIPGALALLAPRNDDRARANAKDALAEFWLNSSAG